MAHNASAQPYAEPMSRNTLVINCDLRETRVCLIEDGVIAELHVERASQRGTVGNIVLGRVTRVLPGMQAAFIDIGMERAAFLHVEDLIRPNDFEAYLDKDDGREELPSGKGDGGRRFGSAQQGAGDEDEAVAGADPRDLDEDDVESSPEQATSPVAAPVSDEAETEQEAFEDDDDEDADSEESEQPTETAMDSEDSQSPDSGPDQAVVDESDGEEEEDSGLDSSDALGDGSDEEEQSDPDSSTALASDITPSQGGGSDSNDSDSVQESEALPPQAAAVAEPRGSRRRRRRRRGKNDNGVTGVNDRGSGANRDGARVDAGGSGSRPREAGRRRDLGRDRRAKTAPNRVSRSVPITEIVKEGDEAIVQISKEPIGTKGARVTSHVSLPGRHVVYLPTVEHVGISRRIGSTKERQRLRQVIDTLKPDTGGLIVRTVAEGLTKKNLKTDIGYLIGLWKEISKKRAQVKAPAVLYTELDLVLKTARDLFTDEVNKVIIDDREQYARLVRFVEMFSPSRVKDIELYSGDEPIFDAFGIEDEIGRALGRKVPLPSGGYLVIDQAEALTAIDVNTGRYVGKGSKDLEETALKTNLEAVNEIAYQLRLRNIGGLVILDLIDMEQAANREKVWRALEQHLAKDKAKTTINRISELGLIEMTRKRTRESLTRLLHEPCFYCDGTGQIQSRTTVAYEILRQVRRERHLLPGYVIVVNAHPAIIDLLQTDEKVAVQEAERRYMRRIDLVPRREYHLEQFDLQGR